MDFFESQDLARRNTGWLVFLFVLAVLGIIATVFLFVTGLIGYLGRHELAEQNLGWVDLLDPGIFFAVATVTLLVVAGGSLFKLIQLRGGGTAIAEALGGRRINPDSTDPTERRVLNVVEEMAIASGTPAPPVYLLDAEEGINAFAAGFSPSDAVIGVTRGTAQLLSRDELQGVIAHEFSHILNGDMRLNLRLIAVLHGILVIGILGYFVLRSAFYSGLARSHSRSERSNPLPLIALGVGLMVIGFVGTFFGKLIKAAVSRQREYLADAAAVQFTRNPAGIAGALKKIGGFHMGSQVQSPNAPEASHMFFGEGAIAKLGGMLSTHPPLPQRIRRIEPSWEGPFPAGSAGAVPMEDELPASGGARGAAPDAALGFAAQAAASGTQDLRAGLAHIGQPTEEHVRYAAELLRGLPPPVAAAAHEPYGARALIYALLINTDPTARKIQLDRLAQAADQGVQRETIRLLPVVERLDAQVRLPVIDMAIPALRALSPSQYQSFKQNVIELIRADQKLDLFEWSLQRILLHHVEPQFTRVRPPRVKHHGLERLRAECEVLLSCLAYAGHENEEHALVAFEQAASSLGLRQMNPIPFQNCGLDALDAALDRLVLAAPRLKRQVLNACATCISADRQVTVEEAELLRAISDTLDCPMPPLLPGQRLA